MQEGKKGFKRKERNSKEEKITLEGKRKNSRRKERFQEKMRESRVFFCFFGSAISWKRTSEDLELDSQ